MQFLESDARQSPHGAQRPLAERQVVTHDADDTRAFGVSLGRRAMAGDVIACCGPLGAGKTTLIQGFAEGLEVGEGAYVRSPTFTLMHEYPGRLPLFHFDFYRLSQVSEVYDIGFEECCESGGVVVVEWAEKFPEVLPSCRLELVIRIASAQCRCIQYRIFDPAYRHYLADHEGGERAE